MLYTTYIYTYIHMYTYIQHMDKFFIDDIFALINLNLWLFPWESSPSHLTPNCFLFEGLLILIHLSSCNTL